MENKKESDTLKNPISEKQEKTSKIITKSYDQTVEYGKQLGKESLSKLNDVTGTGTNYIKSSPYWKSLKNGSLKFKEKSLDSAIHLKENSPRFYKKISGAFFNFFETIVGRVKLGTQYGSSSLETLEKLAKLKELGILTDEEFASKKKKILDRI